MKRVNPMWSRDRRLELKAIESVLIQYAVQTERSWPSYIISDEDYIMLKLKHPEVEALCRVSEPTGSDTATICGPY